VFYLAVKVKFIDLVSWSLLGLFLGLLVLSLLWIPVPGVKALRTRLLSLVKGERLPSYDWLKGAHKVLFVALAVLTYVHVIGAKLIGVASPLSSLAFQALFVAMGALFVWTRIRNLTLPTLAVRSVAVEGGVIRLDLSPHPRLRYRAGQFAFLRFPHPALRGEEHPFSFTSAPHEAGVHFAMRALGDFTAKLADLRPGDLVRVNGGFGAFHPNRGVEPLALIGSGIGAAPLVSILKDVAAQQFDREVVCLLSVTRRDELVEAEALKGLEATMPHLRLKIFVYEEDGLLYGPELLARELGDPGRYRYYLCSSDKVRSIVVGALTQLGVKRRKVHFEAFNLG
jgi:predicted ferric reductase